MTVGSCLVSTRKSGLLMTVRNRIAGLARRLPPPRDQAALAVLRDLRALSAGTVPAGHPVVNVVSDEGSLDARPIGPPLARVAPITPGSWTPAPEVPGIGQVVRSVYDTGNAPQRFDVALLEQLNAEYADRPIVPKPRSYTAKAMSADAPGRISWAHSLVDLRNTTVLEVGCGHGRYPRIDFARDFFVVVLEKPLS